MWIFCLQQKPWQQGYVRGGYCWHSDIPCVVTVLLLMEDRAMGSLGKKTPVFAFLWQSFSLCSAWIAGALDYLQRICQRLTGKKNKLCNLLQKHRCEISRSLHFQWQNKIQRCIHQKAEHFCLKCAPLSPLLEEHEDLLNALLYVLSREISSRAHYLLLLACILNCNDWHQAGLGGFWYFFNWFVIGVCRRGWFALAPSGHSAAYWEWLGEGGSPQKGVCNTPFIVVFLPLCFLTWPPLPAQPL